MIKATNAQSILTTAIKLKSILKQGMAIMGYGYDREVGMQATFVVTDLTHMDSLGRYEDLNISNELDLIEKFSLAIEESSEHQLYILTQSSPTGVYIVSLFSATTGKALGAYTFMNNCKPIKTTPSIPNLGKMYEGVKEAIGIYSKLQTGYHKQAAGLVKPEHYINEEYMEYAAFKYASMLEVINCIMYSQDIAVDVQPDGSWLYKLLNTGEIIAKLKVDMMGEVSSILVVKDGYLHEVEDINSHYLGQASQYLIEALKASKALMKVKH